MNDSQRAMVAARLANMPWGGDRKSEGIKVSSDTLIDWETAAAEQDQALHPLKPSRRLARHPVLR
jgi:hypothetical protein